MGKIRYLRDVPPAHYLLKIDSFQKLLDINREKYVSKSFEASGYNWKLSFYPNGRVSGNGAGYISLYLEPTDSEAFGSVWPVHVNLKMFVLNKKLNRYLTIQDDERANKPRRFEDNENKNEWGFNRLISQVDFKDPSKGYLINDKCEFGVEVFVDKHNRKTKGESMSIITINPSSNSYKWLLTNFSAKKEIQYSPIFTIADCQWKLKIWPLYDGDHGAHLGVALELVNSATLSGKRGYYYIGDWHGDLSFMELSILKDVSNGFLERDNLNVEVKILAISSAEDF